jgi:four helix bundle protein
MKAEKRSVICVSGQGFCAAYCPSLQLLRSGTSVAAHYREACRAKSNPDFINKLEGGLQELDETDLWLELLGDAGTIKSARIEPLRTEVDELISIFVTMIRKINGRR